MPEQLQELLTRLKGDRDLFLSGEEATRQGAVLPILARLGWDRDNIREVVPEYTVGNGRVDYCLKIGEQVSVFVEVKRTNEQLENHQHQEQLLEYAFRQGVKIAVLTNGLLWWFYLPLFPGSWDQRKFFAIDIQELEIGSAAAHFMLFLSREAIASGTAIKGAEEMHADREQMGRIKRTIPKAWRELCQNPDEELVALLAAKVESLCGLRPGEDVLAEFLVGTLPAAVLPPLPPPPTQTTGRVRSGPPGVVTPHPTGDDDMWTFKAPVAFRFKGQRHQVSTFREILMTLCEMLNGEHGQDFQKVLTLRGRRKPHFSTDYRGMNSPQEVPGTGIYVETVLSANAVRNRCNELVTLFGYQPSDLQVEFRSS